MKTNTSTFRQTMPYIAGHVEALQWIADVRENYVLATKYFGQKNLYIIKISESKNLKAFIEMDRKIREKENV